MTNSFVTKSGKSIDIGNEIGRGGEGSVYEVRDSDLVAKLYNKNHEPDAQKQEKLLFMAATADAELLNYVAWPLETLHKTKNSPVAGFLMPRILGRLPIHMLYGPAHRRQDYPQAAWDFLLVAARNTAAAFSAIHRHGHVIGDVNQGNVLVGKDAKVILIDSDSFQISANHKLHPCKVGVAHFTPPELQDITSFEKIKRTSNHDNFGLALLIFHLLQGGRHPYSGVPLIKEAGNALESDVKAFRYAYAPDAQKRGFKPPPNSIPINFLPDHIQQLFFSAFTEPGINGRPSASHWVATLDELRNQLIRCANTPMHVYPNHLKQCPWCSLEKQGIIFFIDIRPNITSSGNSFILTRAWAVIEAVQPPPLLKIPDLNSIQVTPAAIPAGIKRDDETAIWRFVMIPAAAFLIYLLPELWFFVLIGTWWAWASAGSLGEEDYRREHAKRLAELHEAEKNFRLVIQNLEREASPEKFLAKKQELTRYREEYEKLPEKEKQELAKLQSTAEARQKKRFLENYFIDAATITGVGPAKKAALRSFGIETAADVTWKGVIAVKGFGEALTQAVVDWRKTCERRFVFNPNQSITDTERDLVCSQIARRRQELEAILNAGATNLHQIQQYTIDQAHAMEQQLLEASRALAQAQADINALRMIKSS